ncbi:MAG: hypothetical protein AAB923_02595 [Patescibacteria group bacterium]
MNKAVSFISRFYRYQSERFPVLVILATLAPALASSGAVALGTLSWGPFATALVVSLLYLFHIRALDERRDFGHDTVHHAARPMQTGLITRAELARADFVAVLGILGLALWAGPAAFAYAAFALLYAHLAGNEFFLGERLRERYFLYNAVNLVQMLLMQVLVYALFSGWFVVTPLIVAHFAFTSTGTLILEFVRKLKIPGEDGPGKDTYTHYLGFSASLVIHASLILVNVLLFIRLMAFAGGSSSLATLVAVFFTALSVFLALAHYAKPRRVTEVLLQLAFVVGYGVMNVMVAFAILG